jgi:carotenoid cleavage dioxygenase-like enzyme
VPEPVWESKPNLPTTINVFPRRGSVRDIRWFAAPTRKCYHYFNAFNERMKIPNEGAVADAEDETVCWRAKKSLPGKSASTGYPPHISS